MKNHKSVCLLAFCYGAALLFWFCTVSGSLGLSGCYRQMEKCPHVMLTRADVQADRMKDYDNSDLPEGDWLVSTDSDPALIWEGEAWINRVVLHMEHNRPANGIELYYQVPGTQDWSARRLVYAKKLSENQFAFDLCGQYVTALRIDPDSVGGVLERLDGIELNAPVSPFFSFVPNGGQALLLFFSPAVAAAFMQLILSWLQKEKR